MKLSALIKGVAEAVVYGATDREITSLTYDSRTVATGSCFFAIVGTRTDGHAYIPTAVEHGASVIVCQQLPEGADTAAVSYVVCPDTEQAMAIMAAAYYGNPSSKLKIVGITGTNGKTTIATLLYNLVRALGHKAGLISTIVYKVDEEQITSTHTTPDSLRLNEMFAKMVERGCEYCFMECSSHAIAQKRIYGIEFTGAVFTNLTQDHLDYHKTFKEYMFTKKRLFDNLSKRAFALVNVDDKSGRTMLQNCNATHRTYALRNMADYKVAILETLPEAGMLLRFDRNDVWVSFLGNYNAANLTAVYATAIELGFEQSEVLQAISTLVPVEGRFNILRAADGTLVIIDYAHTPDAIEKLLTSVEEFRKDSMQVTVVCGCGGDRDSSKRCLMGKAAVDNSNRAIFTSDNPRSESPEQIIEDMTTLLPATADYLKIADRDTAIKTAIMLSRPGDIVVIAGKGHENYQIIGDQKIEFNDKERAIYWLAALNRNN